MSLGMEVEINFPRECCLFEEKVQLYTHKYAHVHFFANMVMCS